jgi:surface antigen
MGMLRAITTITTGLVVGLSALGGAATAVSTETGTGTGYPAGQCTAYVASQLSWIPSNWGNADLWLIDARRAGFTTISGADVDAALPGDVAVIAADAHTSDGRASDDGHVGIVTAIDESAGTVTLSSANWPEGDTTPRSLTFATSDIEGYILPPSGASMPASLSTTSSATSQAGTPN